MFPRLEQTIREQMDERPVAGLSIALVRGGDVVWERACGTASVESGDPVTTATSFAIMSVTKTVVSTALMQLRDEGHFHLDDPANKHLAPVRIQNPWEEESPVRVSQFMTHTSGLPVGIGPTPPGKTGLEDFVSVVGRCERRPGDEILYANWGFDAMGVLISRFSGKSVDTCLRDRIFEPLDMSTAVLGDPLPDVPHATGHFRSFVDGRIRTLPLPDWPTIPASPAGAIWATAHDVARFLAAHLSGGGQLLSQDTTAEMHRLHIRQANSKSGMGLGFRVTRSNGRRLVCHGGDGSGFTAFLGGYPDEGVGVVLLINTAGMQAARSIIGNTALALLVNASAPRIFGPAKLVPGLYRSTFWDIGVEARDGDSPTLTTTEGLVVADEAGEAKLTPIAHSTFAAEGGMFHGFEVSMSGEQIVGGVYPFTFVRTGDLPVAGEPVDDEVDLVGTWAGIVRTPMGALATTISVSESAATIASPLTGEQPLDSLCVHRGRLEGEFAMSVPGLGEFQNFVRLAAIRGRLVGKVFARGNQGETGMPAELDRK
jgi:CubicO group peptidase (beta-lactamase class C family)